MKRFFACLIVFLVGVLSGLPLKAEVQVTGHVASTIQNLESKVGGLSGKEDYGFSPGLFNLQFEGPVGEGERTGYSAFAELHNSINRIDVLQLREAYVQMEGLWGLNRLRFGRFELPFGTQPDYRSVNGRTRDNRLVGNTLTDFGGVESGFLLNASVRGIDLNLAVTNGDTDSRNGITSDRHSYLASAEMNLLEYVTGKFSFYSGEVNSGGNNYFATAGGDNYLFSHSDSTAVTSLDLSDTKTTALQLDVVIDFMEDHGIKIGLYGGRLTTNQLSSEDRYQYGNAQVIYRLTPASYLAGRYGVIRLDNPGDLGVGNKEKVIRRQFGFAHELNPTTTVKLEYVTQSAGNEHFDRDSGAQRINEFGGIVGEVSVGF